MTLGTSWDPARSRAAMASARARAGQFGGAQGAPQPPGLVTGFGAVAGRQGRRGPDLRPAARSAFRHWLVAMWYSQVPRSPGHRPTGTFSAGS
jgi:hypothetical protein